MPLKFNGEVLDPEDYKNFVSHLIPKGKNKNVTFVIENARPAKWVSDKGQEIKKMTAEVSIPTHDTVTINTKSKGLVTGILQYYETNQKLVRGNAVIDNMEPNYLHFAKNSLTFNAKQKDDLYFFLVVNSKNKDNAHNYGTVPEFHQVKPSEVARKTVADMDLEIEALNKLRELKKNKKQLRAFYETKGHMDWEEHINKEQEDFDSILAPLFEFCKLKPKEALEMMNDAGLELGAKAVKAFNKGLLTQDGTAIYWGEGYKPELEGKKRKIVNIPKGRSYDWQEWFINSYLRSEVEIMHEINTELAIAEVAG